ncbi:MAG: hypothetical protein ACQEQV_06980 [Fibrobacterota bacterium]
MLKKILFRRMRRFHLFGAAAGTMLGLFLLMLSLQIFFDINSLFQSRGSFLNPQYIVINKSVAGFNLEKMKKNRFTPTEIRKLENQPFINTVEEFTPGYFEVYAFSGMGKLLPRISTQLFFEALPNEYIDIDDTASWHWDSTQNIIPISIPRQYINLYNFGFSQGQNLPQLSDEMIKKFDFKVRITGQGKRDEFSSRIVGFSEKINTILVPKEFMKWANRTYGNPDKKGRPSRLLLVVDDPSDPRIYTYLKEKGFKTAKSIIDSGRVRVFVNIAFIAITLISAVIIVLSFLVFVLSFQQTITRTEEDIRNLIFIGFPPLSLSRIYRIYFLKYMTGLSCVSLILFAGAKAGINKFGAQLQIPLPPIAPQTVVIATVLTSAATWITLLIIRREVSRLA